MTEHVVSPVRISIYEAPARGGGAGSSPPTPYWERTSVDLDREGEARLIRFIMDLTPPGSAPTALLQDLTAELIQLKRHRGALRRDPLTDVRRHLPASPEIGTRVHNKTILITGGAGCVGTALVHNLRGYGPRRIVILSRNPGHSPIHTDATVQFRNVDLRMREELTTVFEEFRPDVVFHLAAQRLPSLGEIEIANTITTNVFGTRNILELSHAFGCRQCIVSSTAKAVNYSLSQVYNQTKKLEEWQLLAAAIPHGPAYGLVRFTHIIDNSWLLHKVREGIARGYVGLQGPECSFYAQSVEEAAALLLNALTLVEPGRARLYVSENLGWPLDLLDLALYKIAESGVSAGIYFTGTQPGYEDHIFRGVLDWNHPTRSMPQALLNALESQIDDPRAAEIGVTAAQAPRCDREHLRKVLDRLAVEMAPGLGSPTLLRKALYVAVQEMAFHAFSQSDPLRLLEVARWGASPHVLTHTGATIEQHRDTLVPLVRSLLPKVGHSAVHQSGWQSDEWDTFLDQAASLPELSDEIKQWKTALCLP